MRRDKPAAAGGENPKCGGGTLADNDAGRVHVAQDEQTGQRIGGVGRAAGRVEIQNALAAGRGIEDFFGDIGFALGQIAADGDLERAQRQGVFCVEAIYNSNWQAVGLVGVLRAESTLGDAWEFVFIVRTATS